LSGYLKKDERYDECVGVGTQVRFLVQEFVGVTWSDYSAFLRKRLSAIPQQEIATVHISQTDSKEMPAVMIEPEETEHEKVSKELIILEIKIAKKALQLVQGLHELGFVHGDFHSGNIAFRNPKLSFEDIGKDMESIDEMILIDFGLAKEFRSDEVPDESDASIKDLNPILLSPWQLEGKRRSPRDDVFRVLEALAYNLNPASMKSFSQELGQIRAIRDLTLRTKEQLKLNERIIAHKTSSSMFGGSQGCCVDLSIDTRELQNMLNEIMKKFILILDNPDDVPDYQSINIGFDTVIEFLASN
jgi:serine/threonine protein kinase